MQSQVEFFVFSVAIFCCFNCVIRGEVACTPCVSNCEVSSESDVIFLADTSGSTKNSQIKEEEKGLIRGVMNAMDLGLTKVKTGLITFSNLPNSLWNLADSAAVNIQEACDKLGDYPKSKGDTRTDRALRHLRTVFAPDLRGNACHTVVIMTDGGSDKKELTIGNATALHDMGVRFCVVSFGEQNEIREEELAGLSGDDGEILRNEENPEELTALIPKVLECINKCPELEPAPSCGDFFAGDYFNWNNAQLVHKTGTTPLNITRKYSGMTDFSGVYMATCLGCMVYFTTYDSATVYEYNVTKQSPPQKAFEECGSGCITQSISHDANDKRIFFYTSSAEPFSQIYTLDVEAKTAQAEVLVNNLMSAKSHGMVADMENRVLYWTTPDNSSLYKVSYADVSSPQQEQIVFTFKELMEQEFPTGLTIKDTFLFALTSKGRVFRGNLSNSAEDMTEVLQPYTNSTITAYAMAVCGNDVFYISDYDGDLYRVPFSIAGSGSAPHTVTTRTAVNSGSLGQITRSLCQLQGCLYT